MLLVAREDLLAAAQLQAAEYHCEALGGAGGEREVLGGAPEQRGVGGPQGAVQLSTTLEVAAGAALLRLAPQLSGGGVHGGAGQRAVGARVEVRQAAQDGEPFAQRAGS